VGSGNLADLLTWPEVANNALNVIQIVALTYLAAKAHQSYRDK